MLYPTSMLLFARVSASSLLYRGLSAKVYRTPSFPCLAPC